MGELGEALPDTYVLIGFSKGASVVNALLTQSEEAEFWNKCESVHFVDPGLVMPGSFSVSQEALETLKANSPDNFAVWVHATPRQIEDSTRPFIAQEVEAFVQRCTSAELQIRRRTYAEGLPPSLDMHFDALRCFCTGPDDADCGDKHCGFFAAWRALSD